MYCSECSKPVVIVDGKIIRKCKHKDASIIADINTSLVGKGKVK
jgi:hypothetical protein